MEDISDIVDAKNLKEVSQDGARLFVIASRLENEQWRLSVQDEYGIVSGWLEFFPGTRGD